MEKRKKQADLLQQIATRYGVSVRELVWDMQAVIDATWDNPDPMARAKQRRLFPDGKPSIEEFIRVMAEQVWA